MIAGVSTDFQMSFFSGLLIVLLAVSGCAPTSYWHKPSATNAQVAGDDDTCHKSRAAPDVSGFRAQEPSPGRPSTRITTEVAWRARGTNGSDAGPLPVRVGEPRSHSIEPPMPLSRPGR